MPGRRRRARPSGRSRPAPPRARRACAGSAFHVRSAGRNRGHVIRSIVGRRGARIGGIRTSGAVFPHRAVAECGFPAPIRGRLPTRRAAGRGLLEPWILLWSSSVTAFRVMPAPPGLASMGVPVTMIGPGLPHDRPPLSKRSLLTGRLPLLADSAQLVERGIEHIDGVVTACDLDRRRLEVSPSGGGAALGIEASTLVWATGLRYPRPPVPGFERADENATGAGLVVLNRRLSVPGRRVVVVGAGLIGTETAATLAAKHDVTLARHARPAARAAAPAPVRGCPGRSRVARRALSRLVQHRVCDRRMPPAPSSTPRPTATSAATFSSRLPAFARASCPSSWAPIRERSRSRPTSSSACSVTSGSGPAATVSRSRILAGAVSRSRTGITPCGAAATLPTPSSARVTPYVREPYFFSDIGSLRIQQVGVAAAAVEWSEDGGLAIGLDSDRRARVRGPTQLSGAAARGARASRGRGRTARHHPIVGGTSCPYA